MSDAVDERGATGSEDASLRATVELALMAHHIRPDESLAVRLLGTVGPDGSWALDGVGVHHERDHIVLEPRVRRVQGDMFIQMVIPLDHTVKLALDAGVHRIDVLRRGATLVDSVRVSPDAQRERPVAALAPASALHSARVGAETIESLPFTARVADGWIERVEVRDAVAGQQGNWRAPEMLQRVEAGGVRGTLSIRRPAEDPTRTVEVRAIDGQGGVSSVVSMELPPL